MPSTAAGAPRPSSPEAPSSPPDALQSDQIARAEPRNFAVLAAFQVVMRTGWIFKTESIVMPAVLDLLGGGAWLRGCLPMLNRFGQSVPPMIAADGVKRLRQKKWGQMFCALMMAAVFLALWGIWTDRGAAAKWSTPEVFLALYAVFFMSTGINQLIYGTLQGKLIRPTRRGRLLLASDVVGGASAICFAAWLMPKWLAGNAPNFALFFGFTGICFAIAAASTILLDEPADSIAGPSAGLGSIVGDAWRTLRDDANFRRLAAAAALFGSSFMLFPHYQAVGLQRMQTPLSHLMWWVILQNLGTALFSFVAGSLADWRGYRLVLQLILAGVAAAPLAAIGLSHAGGWGEAAFGGVFVLVGMTPVTVKTLNNYALEICETADHPRYLSTLSLCMAGPAIASPALGLLVDWLGFDAAFGIVAALLLAGWLLTFGLREPRHHHQVGAAASSITGTE